MICGKRITLTVEGQAVEGEIIQLLPNDIEVQITAPYTEGTRSLHVPHFMMGHEPNRLSDENGHITPRGIEKAEKLLAEIYEECRVKERH
jgi:hypothetical protein